MPTEEEEEEEEGKRGGEKQKSEEVTGEEGIESGRRSMEEVEAIGQSLTKPITPAVVCGCIT